MSAPKTLVLCVSWFQEPTLVVSLTLWLKTLFSFYPLWPHFQCSTPLYCQRYSDSDRSVARPQMKRLISVPGIRPPILVTNCSPSLSLYLFSMCFSMRIYIPQGQDCIFLVYHYTLSTHDSYSRTVYWFKLWLAHLLFYTESPGIHPQWNQLLGVCLLDFSGGSDDKESACNVGDPRLIPELGRSPEKGMATHSSILAWRIPWTEEPGGL